jgi:hypothetical protein
VEKSRKAAIAGPEGVFQKGNKSCFFYFDTCIKKSNSVFYGCSECDGFDGLCSGVLPPTLKMVRPRRKSPDPAGPSFFRAGADTHGVSPFALIDAALLSLILAPSYSAGIVFTAVNC